MCFCWHHLFIHNIRDVLRLNYMFPSRMKKQVNAWKRVKKKNISENNTSFQTVFYFSSCRSFIFRTKFRVTFSVDEIRKQVLYQLIWSHTTIYKWEKFHWIWHHIIQSKRQVTLMWIWLSFFFFQQLASHRCMRFINMLHRMTNRVAGFKWDSTENFGIYYEEDKDGNDI